jgi:hypothetical protein
LLLTPGLVLGVAAGDVICVDPTSRKVQVRERGGNIAVQVFARADCDFGGLTEFIVAATEAMGGWLDGVDPGRLLVLTFPLAAGFPNLEAFLNAASARYPGSEWYFGNVYEQDSGEPLNWWSAR